MDIIHKYFPSLSDDQFRKFELFSSLYMDWNHKINLISRKDITFFYERHILHSLAIARFIRFLSGTIVADVGTGGGFPGIPLAIVFPKVRFFLIDSIAKKIRVVSELSKKLDLTNIGTINDRAESVNLQCDFVVSRAVAPLPDFYRVSSNLIRKRSFNHIPNGIIYLKGGDFEEELRPFGNRAHIFNIRDYFEEDFFNTKKIVYISTDRDFHF